jgi:hypothetical protein
MATSFPTLGDNDIDTAIYSEASIFGVSYGMQDNGPTGCRA